MASARSESHTGFDVAAAAQTLLEAWSGSDGLIASLEAVPSPPSITEVYALHAAMAQHPLFTSAPLCGLGGYKQGGIGAAIDPASGEPVAAAYGILPRSRLLREQSPVEPIASKSAFNLFGLEAEIGFTMARSLPPRGGAARGGGGGDAAGVYTEDEVWAAVRSVHLTIELVARRFDLKLAGDATSLQSLGDSSCAGAVVLGAFWSTDDASCPSPARLAAVQTSIAVNDETRATGGAGNNPLGSPLASLTWCANHLNTRGLALQPGELVIAGACCKTRDWAAGDAIAVTFEGLGVVECSIGE